MWHLLFWLMLNTELGMAWHGVVLQWWSNCQRSCNWHCTITPPLHWRAQLLHHCTAHWASRFCQRPRPQQPPKLVTHWKRRRGHPVVGQKSPRWEGELETKTHTQTTQWWHPCHALGCQGACIVWGSYIKLPLLSLACGNTKCWPFIPDRPGPRIVSYLAPVRAYAILKPRGL